MVLNSNTPMCSAYTAVPERVTTPTRRGVAATDDDAVAPHPAGGGDGSCDLAAVELSLTVSGTGSGNRETQFH